VELIDKIREIIREEKKNGRKPKNLYIGRSTFIQLRKECFMPTTVDYDLTKKRYQASGLDVYLVDAEEHLAVGG